MTVFFAAALILSCSGPAPAEYSAPEFTSVRPARLEMVSAGIGPKNTVISGLFPYKGCLVVVFAGTFDHFVTLYDLASDSVVASCIGFGGGEFEMVHCHGTSFDHVSGELFLYDYSTSKMLCVNLEKWISENADDFVSRVDIGGIASHAEEIYYIPDGWLVMNGFPKKYQGRDTTPRFEVYDRNFKLIASNSEKVDIGEIERLTLYDFPPIAFEPDGSRWYLVSAYGGIWESFQLSGKNLKRFSLRYFYESDMETHMNDYFGSSTVNGFHDLCYHNDRLYAVSDFEHTLKELFSKDFDGLTDSDITVYDREGNPLECFRTQFKIEKICFDGEIMYALVGGNDGQIHVAKYDFSIMSVMQQ